MMCDQFPHIGIDIHSPRIDGDLDRLGQDLATFEQAGFDVAEIPVHGVDAIIAGKLRERRVRSVQEILRQFKLSYTVHAPDFVNLWDLTRLEEHLNVFTSSIRFAGAIGATRLVYHQGRIPESTEERFSEEDKARRVEIEQLQALGDVATDNGVTICVENLPHVFRPLEDLLGVVEAVSHERVRICLDLGHAFLVAGERGFDYLEAIKRIKPLVAHIHTHDNYGSFGSIDPKLSFRVPYILRLPYGVGDLHLPVGWGGVPFDAVFELFHDYDGIWLVELDPRYSDEHPHILSTIRQGLAAPRSQVRTT